MPAKRSLSLKEKAEIIRAHEAGENKHAVANRLGRDRKIIRRVIKNKDAILHEIENGKSVKMKRIKKPKYIDVDASLVGWMKFARSQNIPISGEILKVRQ